MSAFCVLPVGKKNFSRIEDRDCSVCFGKRAPLDTFTHRCQNLFYDIGQYTSKMDKLLLNVDSLFCA